MNFFLEIKGLTMLKKFKKRDSVYEEFYDCNKYPDCKYKGK
jgi:ssDNA-binding Zn-finger/Zn-ribbon topoisomerase 1